MLVLADRNVNLAFRLPSIRLKRIVPPPIHQPILSCMFRPAFALSGVLLLVAISSSANGLAAELENWPGWRGPRGDGTSLEQNIPTTWDGTTGENIAWQVPIPGKGHSSPIVWQDRIFVASCLEETQERVLLCLDRKTGKVVWQKTVIEAPLEKKHALNSFASGTPATDGRRVFVSFLNTDMPGKDGRTPGDLIVTAYDFDGNRLWQSKPGRFASVHGFCSSPVLFEDTVIINGDHDGDSYIAALSQESGETIWKTPREFKTRSYVTPLIREINGRTQMMFSGSKQVVSLDPRTGEQQWRLKGPTEQFVASLVYDGKYVYLTAGFPEHHILAIDPEQSGELDDKAIIWRTTKSCSYVPSPVLCGPYFVIASDEGIGSCYLAQEGKLLWNKRMGKHYSGSLVTAAGLVYLTADDGITKVVRPGEELDVVAENPLGEYCYSSPAISQGQIFLRSEKSLYCIGK